MLDGLGNAGRRPAAPHTSSCWPPAPRRRDRQAEVANGAAEDPLRRIRNNLGDGSIDVEEVARALGAVVRLLDEKGYVSRDELRRALEPERRERPGRSQA